jgi:glycosyltransferase involved in cell wall biosynthesis
MQIVKDRPLRICLLSYRSNPHSGGQGVYIKNLSRALVDLGHCVAVVSGPPNLYLDDDIHVHRLPSLDLYDPQDPFRMPSLKELLHPLNLIEWLGVSTMGFPEPFIFGIRAYLYLKQNAHRYDIVHDNQSLSYGVWAIKKILPTVATIHHPITVDRNLAIRDVSTPWRKMKQLRWYSFIGMQKRVARTLPHIITVSKCARTDISRDFKIPLRRFRIAPNGIDTEQFHPMPSIELYYLLQAIAQVSRSKPVRLIVVGQPKKNGSIEKLVRELGIENRITFTGRIDVAEFVRQYARASVAVIPSVYEGFGLPAGEAMACAVPVISTSGGALPEVVGDAGILVPPADTASLVSALSFVLDNPEKANELGRAGYQRVHRHFTWERAARLTLQAYTEVIFDHHRFSAARN